MSLRDAHARAPGRLRVVRAFPKIPNSCPIPSPKSVNNRIYTARRDLNSITTIHWILLPTVPTTATQQPCLTSALPPPQPTLASPPVFLASPTPCPREPLRPTWRASASPCPTSSPAEGSTLTTILPSAKPPSCPPCHPLLLLRRRLPRPPSPPMPPRIRRSLCPLLRGRLLRRCP